MPQQHKILITKPCSKNWDAMLPTNMGRHCNSCKKDVVDFTLMKDEDVRNYLLNNIGKETCGRFYTHQIDRIKIVLPDNIFQTRLVSWKKFIIVLMVCFGVQLFSIEVSFGQTIDSTLKIDTNPKDTMMGDGIVDSFDIENKIDTSNNDTIELGLDTAFAIGSSIVNIESIINIESIVSGGIGMIPVDIKQEIWGTFSPPYLEPVLDTSSPFNPPKNNKKKTSKKPNKKMPLNSPPFLPEEIFTFNRRKKSK